MPVNDGPCAIFMIGARPEVTIPYPVSEVAAKYGASARRTPTSRTRRTRTGRAITSRCASRGRSIPAHDDRRGG